MRHSFYKNMDVESLHSVVQEVLKRATNNAADLSLLPGNKVEIKEFTSKCNSPLLKLKKISCQVAFKELETLNEQTIEEMSKSIIEMLSSAYHPAEMAVLTLAAFALDYGEFWLHYQSQFPASLRFLRRDRAWHSITQGNLKRREALVNLTKLVKATYQMTDYIFKLEKLLDIAEIPDCDKPSQDIIQKHSQVAISYIVLCMAQITCLAQERACILELSEDLLHEAEEYKEKLKLDHKELIEKAEEIKAYKKLRLVFGSNAGIMEVIERFMYSTDGRATLCYGSSIATKQELEKLYQKDILLLISGLNISKHDYSVVLQSRDKAEHEIVWVPVVDPWETEEQKKRLEEVREMHECYRVSYSYSAPIIGIRYAKEEWHFNYKPMVVVINNDGSMQCPDAIHMINIWGAQANPFTFKSEISLSFTLKKEISLSYANACIAPFLGGIHPTLLEPAVKAGNYIIIYGGRDSKWVENFEVKVQKLAIVAGNQSIQIVPFSIAKGEGGVEEVFWRRMESLLYVSMRYLDKSHSKEIQRLLCRKKERGSWALICKGSSILLSGHGQTILKVVSYFGNNNVNLGGQDNFGTRIREYHQKMMVKQTRVPCHHLEIQSFGGWVPEPMLKCPDCGLMVQRMITYRCGHDGRSGNSLGFFSSLLLYKNWPMVTSDLTQKFISEAQIRSVPWFVPFMLLLTTLLFSKFFF